MRSGAAFIEAQLACITCAKIFIVLEFNSAFIGFTKGNIVIGICGLVMSVVGLYGWVKLIGPTLQYALDLQGKNNIKVTMKYYPSGMNLYASSRGLKKPVVENSILSK